MLLIFLLKMSYTNLANVILFLMLCTAVFLNEVVCFLILPTFFTSPRSALSSYIVSTDSKFCFVTAQLAVLLNAPSILACCRLEYLSSGLGYDFFDCAHSMCYAFLHFSARSFLFWDSLQPPFGVLFFPTTSTADFDFLVDVVVRCVYAVLNC